MYVSATWSLCGFLVLVMGVVHVTCALEPLHVYAGCVLANNVPPLENEGNSLLKTTLEVIRTDSGMEKVLSCVEIKVGLLNSTSSALENYMGRTFNATVVREALTKAAAVYNSGNDLHCLRSQLASPQEDCLKGVVTSLDNIKALNISETVMDYCSFELTRCLDVNRLNQSCGPEDFTVLEAANAMFYGKCYSNRVRISTASTVSPSPGPQPAISALFTCGSLYFPNTDLAFLFPPSEATYEKILNVTAARDVQRKSIEEFCSRSDEYGACLRDGLLNPKTAVDTILAQLLNPQNLKQAFSHYCHISALVNANFECTYSQVTHTVCNGGIFDIISRVAMLIHGTHSPMDTCASVIQAQECRVYSQLNTCNVSYGGGMRRFYDLMTSDMCKDSMVPKDYGQGFLCFKDIYHEILMTQWSQNPEETIVHFMRRFCDTRSEWMPCLRQVAKTSTDIYDKIIFSVFIPDNLDAVTAFACSKVDDFRKHSTCVIRSFASFVSSPGNCIVTLQPRYFGGFKDGFAANLISSMCGAIDPYTQCMRTVFDPCNAQLSRDFQTFGSMVDRSCNNPEPIIKTSAGTSVTPAIILLLLSASLGLWRLIL